MGLGAYLFMFQFEIHNQTVIVPTYIKSEVMPTLF